MIVVIPKKINLAGVDVEIELYPGLMEEIGAVGCTMYEQQKILIDPTVDGHDILQQTFVHELVHFILYVMGRQDLRTDEVFVDGFAHIIYQALKQLQCEKTLNEENTPYSNI